ncbi:MAG: RluA family pseudouridine synthase [Acutalibacteraceae bacterium]
MLRELHFTVPEQFDGARGKFFLRSFCGLSYHTVLELKQVENGVTADGVLLRTIDRVHAGQQVVIRLPQEKERPQQAVEMQVPVLYEDDDVLAFDKPPFMPVHPSAGHAADTLANAAAAYLQQKGECATFRPVNRLDRNTSGIVVTAKHAHAAYALSGAVEKAYLAVVQGILTGKGTVDAPLRRMEGHGIRREIGEGGERALTHWRALACGKDHTLLAVRLETGRTHQIRAHFSSLGFPLAGDDMYDGSTELITRHALHCGRAAFSQPVSGEKICLHSPLPKDFRILLLRCGMDPQAAEDGLREYFDTAERKEESEWN